MKIENAYSLFHNAAHFHAFKTAWSKAVNHANAKSRLEDAEDFKGRRIQVRRPGWLIGSHHLVYLAFCGKDMRRGFQPLSNPHKIKDRFALDGFGNARRHLSWLARVIDGNLEISTESYQERVRCFLLPFEGTVTAAMLSALEQRLTEVIPQDRESWLPLFRQD